MKTNASSLFRTNVLMALTVMWLLAHLLVGRPMASAVPFTDAHWISMGATHFGTDGTVEVTTVDAAGNLYIGGSFSNVCGVAAKGVAKWNGTNWSALGAGIALQNAERIYALAVSGSDLYVGGSFRNAGAVQVNGLAKWNGASWTSLGSGVDVVNGREIYALAVSGGDLYVGGSFFSISGVAATGIAKWNGSAWSPLGTGLGGGFPEATVLAPFGNDLYVGGFFNSAGGVSAYKIAKWNGSAWSALGSGVALASGPGSGAVYGLAVSEGQLYVGGSFITAGGVPANYIAKWNGSAWSSLGSGMSARVLTLTVSGGDIYAAGEFPFAGGTNASRIAKWNGSAWSPLGSGLDWGDVFFLSAFSTNLYAGGPFLMAGGESAYHIAKWDGMDWSVPGGGPGLNDRVVAFARYGDDLYVGGSFTRAGEATSSKIAKWTGTNWSALGTGMNGDVSAIAVSSNWVYAAGAFTNAGGTVDRIARWNGSIWSPLGTGLNGDEIAVLAVFGNDLYAGGNFNSIGGVAATNLAKWDGNTWSLVGSGLDQGGYVSSLEVSGNDLYVGGSFPKAGGIDVNFVAKWNGSSWSALGSGLLEAGIITRLAISEGNVYACDYTGKIYKWNGENWTTLPLTIGQGTIAALGGDLYIAANNEALGYVFKWDGVSISMLGSGVNNTVNDVIIMGNALYVGGDFTVAGGKNSGYVAKAIISAAGGRFQNLTYSPAAGFSAVFSDGTVGYPYRIQASPSGAPGSWVNIQNVNYSGPVLVSDPSAINQSNRFFRAVSP
ncbi:MAG TPA: hypothetical protein VFZ59_17135 [Verrucomicrobiae bacterium]|nr:hypothetical protein [Verrucomicrobiae bacterium]